MLKILVRLAFVAVALLIIAVLLVGMFIDKGARQAIEQGGTYALGVETTLGGADVGVLSGEFGLSELAIANPDGFGGEHFLTLQQAGLELDYQQMSEAEVRVPELALDGIFVDLEKKGGETNYGVILDNLARLSGDEGTEPEDPAPETEPAGPKIIFDRIVIRDVEAEVNVLPLGGDSMQIPVHVDEIVLEDVGADGSGVTLDEVFGIVIHTVLTTVLTEGADLIPVDMIQDLGGQLGNLAGTAGSFVGDLSVSVGGEALDLGGALGGLGIDVGAAVGGAVGDVTGDLTEGVGEGLEGAVEGLGGAVEGLGSGLGGLLGGKKDDE